MAELISKIDANNPTTIALDIIFPEEDRTSPKNFNSFYKNYLNINNTINYIPKQLHDNDAIFSQAVQETGSTLSIFLSQNHTTNNKCANNNILKLPLDSFDLNNYSYALCNTDKISSNSMNLGFINIKTDEDGLLRRYQLIRKYKEKLMPSLALATLLKIDPNFKPIDKNTFKIMGHTLNTDKSSNVLLSYYNDSWYKKISAQDILKNKVSAENLTGKIVLIGSSALGLYDEVTIPGGKHIAGVKVHTTLIDNLLHEDLLVQPKNYALINIFLSLCFTLIFFILLVKKFNYSILAVFTLAVIFGLSINIYSLYQGFYISFGYFIIPLLMHFFLVSIIFIFIDTYHRRVFSEELNRSHVALLDSMVHVAEVHDIETGAHIIRTKLYIKKLAQYMYSKGIYKDQLSHAIIKMMYLTAPMHDIGKVGIPDSILKKEGKLTPMEYQVMQTHPDLGKHIINNAISSYNLNDFFVMAKNIAEFHHENGMAQVIHTV